MSAAGAAGDAGRHARRPRLTVVTVTYRSHGGAAQCLSDMLGVARGMQDEIDWIFVDNSEDLSDAAWFARHDLPSNVRVIESPTNPGFAASCNRGVRAADSGWVAFVNPDISVDVASMRGVLAAVEEAPAGVGSFAVGQTTRGRRHLGIGMLGGIWFVDRAPREDLSLLGPSGGFAVLDRAAFEAVGGFDEALFAWGEDVDLALRLRAAGVPCRPVPLFFPHIGGHSFVDDQALRSRKVYLLARNRQRVALRHFTPPRVVAFELMVAAVTVAKAPVHLRGGTLRAVLRGNLAGLRMGVHERRSASASLPARAPARVPAGSVAS